MLVMVDVTMLAMDYLKQSKSIVFDGVGEKESRKKVDRYPTSLERRHGKGASLSRTIEADRLCCGAYSLCMDMR